MIVTIRMPQRTGPPASKNSLISGKTINSIMAIITEDISRNGVNSTFVTTNTTGVYNLRNTKPLPVKGANFIQKITFHQSYSYEEFIEGIKAEVVQDKSDPSSIKRYVNYATKPGIFKTFCSRAEVDLDNKYVLIIDELNRGNISKIFGELITVIEKDKRGTEVLLPYSKLPFSVPKNLYIIGTMNTADRSIAKIDTALTRRFARREIMPNSSVLKDKTGSPATVDGINLPNLLDKLNDKIKTRDRHIGHSYLMNGDFAIDNISDLRLAFLYDIIPLLKELTFDDEEELKEIIGDYFVDYKTKNIKENLTKTRVNTGNNHADNAFKTEMNSFLNSGRTEVESQDTDGDDDDDQDS